MKRLTTKEIALFGVLGAIMFASKMLMELLPNIHLLGTFIVAFTVVYRKKALIPIYVYVFLNGIFAGFAMWWVPYLYVWAILWGMTMLLPKKMPQYITPIVYAVISSLHGFLFGILYAPAQALMFGFNFKQTLAWIAYGFPYDAIHGISNLLCGVLIIPIVKILKRTDKFIA